MKYSLFRNHNGRFRISRCMQGRAVFMDIAVIHGSFRLEHGRIILPFTLPKDGIFKLFFIHVIHSLARSSRIIVPLFMVPLSSPLAAPLRIMTDYSEVPLLKLTPSTIVPWKTRIWYTYSAISWGVVLIICSKQMSLRVWKSCLRIC